MVDWRRSAVSLKLFYFFVSLLFLQTSHSQTSQDAPNVPSQDAFQEPSVFLAIISRNSAHLLSNYLGLIEAFDYPKHRISIWIQTDHNEDNTANILQQWAENVKGLYHRVMFKRTDLPQAYPNDQGPCDWPDARYRRVMTLRQMALDEARKQWADFLFFIDGDNMVANPNTLRTLINKKKSIVAPMLEVYGLKSPYSNFWCGVNEHGYYKRTPEYFPTIKRERVGCFDVPMIHSTYLIDLRRNASSGLVYDPPHPEYQGEQDDILVFAHSARKAGLKLWICNDEVFGYLLPPFEPDTSLQHSKDVFIHTKLQLMVEEIYLPESKNVHVKPETPSNLGFDEIFMINLVRRPERRKRMDLSLKELGINYTWFKAVDGKDLNPEMVEKMGIKSLPGFRDPYFQRPLTMGEVGCFLSHYRIWEDMLKRGLNEVLVLEDDVRFQPNFVEKLLNLKAEADARLPEWDLIYIGRKLNAYEHEPEVEGTKTLIWAGYSYWTLGYLINQRGAQKLISSQPLEKMLPVDEFLPVMFDRHPNLQWKEFFRVRNLLGWSASPLLVYPTHYVGDEGYFSDTEDDVLIKIAHEKKLQEKKMNKEEKTEL